MTDFILTDIFKIASPKCSFRAGILALNFLLYFLLLLIMFVDLESKYRLMGNCQVWKACLKKIYHKKITD